MSIDELKIWLHRQIASADKVLLALAAVSGATDLSGIRTVAAKAGFKFPRTWNLSSLLGRRAGLAIRTPDGWEITDAGRQHLQDLGIFRLGQAAIRVAADLRAHLQKISNPDTRAFVEEAIKCHEAQLYRSAIVMSWLAAVHALYREVVDNHLSAFNAEAQRVDPKWKIAKTSDDLARMKESDFLDRIVAISVIGKSVKDELAGCLKLRNGCGHPNSLKVGPNRVVSHIETLLQNVFEKFKA